MGRGFLRYISRPGRLCSCALVRFKYRKDSSFVRKRRKQCHFSRPSMKISANFHDTFPVVLQLPDLVSTSQMPRPKQTSLFPKPKVHIQPPPHRPSRWKSSKTSPNSSSIHPLTPPDSTSPTHYPYSNPPYSRPDHHPSSSSPPPPQVSISPR